MKGSLRHSLTGTSFVIIHSFSRFYGAEGDMAEVNLNKSLSILSDNRFLKIFVSIFIDLMPLRFYLPPEEIIYFHALRRVELLGEEMIERRRGGGGELISTHQRRTKRELVFSKFYLQSQYHSYLNSIIILLYIENQFKLSYRMDMDSPLKYFVCIFKHGRGDGGE